MFNKIKLGIEDWKKLVDDLERIAEGAPLEMVTNLTLVHSHDEHHHEHHGIDASSIAELVDYISRTHGAEVYQHLHGHHGSVVFSKSGNPKELIKVLRDVLDYIKLNCDCVLHTMDGEFHLGRDLSGIYFGDGYKITVILPNSDGKRLRVHELHF